jgi:hypothetical protein
MTQQEGKNLLLIDSHISMFLLHPKLHTENCEVIGHQHKLSVKDEKGR